MKIFNKLYWLFGLVEVCATYLNPYIGFFGLTNLIELFSLVIFDIIVIAGVKHQKKYGGECRRVQNDFIGLHTKLVSFQNKLFSIVGYYVLPVIFFLIKLLEGAAIFIVSYSSKELTAPYQIWSNPDTMSIVCLIVEMIFNVLFMISFIGRGKIVRRTMAKEN